MYDSYLEHCKKYGEKNTTLDRIDVNGDYCVENCRWATWDIQSKNRRKTGTIIYNGKRYSQKGISAKHGMSVGALRGRLERGWDLNRALNVPLGKKRNYEASSNQNAFELQIGEIELISRINYWKEERGRTTKWIARELEVSQEIVSRWANNKSYPSIHTLFKLAALLECKVDDLYKWKEK